MSPRSRTPVGCGIVAAVLLLGGCGLVPDDRGGPNAPVDEAVEGGERPLTEGEWKDLCGPSGVAPDNPRCTAGPDEPVEGGTAAEPEASSTYSDPYLDEEQQEPQGEWLAFTTVDDANVEHTWEVRVDLVERTTTLPGAMSSSGEDGEKFVEAVAAEGQEFLHAVYSVRNTTGKVDSLTLEASVIFSDGGFQAPAAEAAGEYMWNLTEARPHPAGDDQAPDSVTEGDFVIEIAQGAEVGALVIYEVYSLSPFDLVVGVDE